MKKAMLLTLAGGTLVNGAAMAASPAFTISPDGRTVTVARALDVPPTLAQRAAGTPLFDNLATLDPKGVYTVGSGAGFGDVTDNSPPVELAVAFTAPTTTRVAEVDIGAGYISGTENLVQVHLYQDDGGVPGSEIWSHSVALPVDGTCCAVAALKVPPRVKLTAGLQYWVGLGVAKGAADTFGAWYGNVADQIDSGLTAINQGSGWTASTTLPLPAFGVFAK